MINCYICNQCTPEWFELRNGIPTAGDMGRILSPSACEPAWTCIAPNGETCGIRHRKKDAAITCSKKNKFTPTEMEISLAPGADDYACKLVADRIRGGPEDLPSFSNKHMERGNYLEPQARDYFTLVTGHEVKQIGFITTADGRFGASPDGIIGSFGERVLGENKFTCERIEAGLELKCPTGEVHTKYLLEGILPPEYAAQVHGSIVVSGASHWFFESYSPPLPTFIIKVMPNEYTAALRDALERFDERINEIDAIIKGKK